MTNARACGIVKRMKKIVCVILIFALTLAFSVSFFACKDTRSANETKDKSTLAAEVVNAVFPAERDDKAEIKTALLSLLETAELEDAEVLSVLAGLKSKAEDIPDALLDLKNKDYAVDHAASYQDALQVVSSSVSPEIAGRVFYAAAKDVKTDLPYSVVDCEKLAALLLGGDDLFDVELNLLNGKTENLNEKQLNTAMITLVSALRKATGISAGAKDFLLILAENAIDGFFEAESSKLSNETLEQMQQSKEFLLSVAEVFSDNYDNVLTFAADYFAQADARLFLGLPYEQKECTTYYGYTYTPWTWTPISKEEYDARAGGYDEYIAKEETLNGFTVDGAFVSVSPADSALADKAYRLFTAHKTYTLFSDEKKTAFKMTLTALLTTLAEEQDAVAALLGLDLNETPATQTATFEELIASLPALASFDATDGVSDEERLVAQNAEDTLVKYLHGYFPNIAFEK